MNFYVIRMDFYELFNNKKRTIGFSKSFHFI